MGRHWLVLAIATLLAVAYGTRQEEAEARHLPPGRLRQPPAELHAAHPAVWPPRRHSLLQQGVARLRCLLLRGYLWPACGSARRAGPASHSFLALSLPRPPRSQAPRGPPPRRGGPGGAGLTSRGPDPPPAPGLTPPHPGRAHRSSRLR